MANKPKFTRGSPQLTSRSQGHGLDFFSNEHCGLPPMDFPETSSLPHLSYPQPIVQHSQHKRSDSTNTHNNQASPIDLRIAELPLRILRQVPESIEVMKRRRPRKDELSYGLGSRRKGAELWSSIYGT